MSLLSDTLAAFDRWGEWKRMGVKDETWTCAECGFSEAIQSR